ncbi:hypothetical protein, partial [Corynebacterium sp. HMSC072D01]
IIGDTHKVTGSNGTDLGLEQSAAQAPKNAQLPPPPQLTPKFSLSQKQLTVFTHSVNTASNA